MNRRGFLKFLGVTPAVVAAPAIARALPEASLKPSPLSGLLLEALEKAVNPPLIIDSHAVVRECVSLFPGAVTWVDAEWVDAEFARIGPTFR
jgi:hypothetical protein